MKKDIKEYYSPYQGIMFDKLYKRYYDKLQSGDHLGTHQKFITDLYESVYGKQIIGSHINAILFLFYAISNSCDDIIDNSSPKARKSFASDVIRVYISFFIFFEKIVCSINLFDKMNEIFEAMRTELPLLIAAPYKELNPPSNMENIPVTIIEIENNRCIDHQFICKVLDGIVNQKLKTSKFEKKLDDLKITLIPDLYKIVILYKGFEFIIKDLNSDELSEDIKFQNFNVLTYLYKNGIKEKDHLIKILKKTKSLILVRSEKLNQTLSLPIITLEIIQSSYKVLEKQFENRMNDFEQLYNILLSLMMNN